MPPLQAETNNSMPIPHLSQITATTLQKQAAKALAAGFAQLSYNLVRAAELTKVPDEELLGIYELLRPGRSTYDQLLSTADSLEVQYGAFETAAYVRDAAAEYLRRNLFRRP